MIVTMFGAALGCLIALALGVTFWPEPDVVLAPIAILVGGTFIGAACGAAISRVEP